MKKLSTKQHNNLIAGNSLAVEVSSTSDDMRAFVVISAYRYDENRVGINVSRFLNDRDKDNTLFWLRKYEVKKEYIENEWDVSDEELVNSVFINDIKNMEELENELSKYLDDYSGLDVEWKCENPI